MSSPPLSDALEASLRQFLPKILGVEQYILLGVEAEKTEIISYICTSEKTKESLFSLCCQLIKQNETLWKQGQLIRWTIEDGQGYSINWGKLASQAQVDSLILLPLNSQQSNSFKICCFSQRKQGIEWTKEQLTLISYLANQWLLIAEQNHQIKSLQEQSKHQKLIKKINLLINYEQEKETILVDIVRLIGGSLDFEQVLLFRAEMALLILEQEWAFNKQNYPSSQKIISVDEWLDLLDLQLNQLTQHVTIKPIFINLDNLAKQQGFLISFPLLVSGRFWGIFCLQTRNYQQKIDKEYLDTLENLAVQISLAIERIQKQDKWVTEQIQKLESDKKNLEIAKKKTSEFLSHLTHELRTPLTGILSFSRMLQDQIYGTLNEKQSTYVDVIVSSGEHLLSLINDLLDLSKIEANREEICLETMAVEDVCLASLSLVKGKALEGKLELKLDIAPDVDLCKGDQKRIKQILVNLLSNAIKFTEDGSITLRVEKDEKKIKFSVIDTGIGISYEDQQKLFQPFQQIKNRLSRKHKGTGLGLALSRKFAQLHGGDITLISEEGKGSCFTFHLPL